MVGRDGLGLLRHLPGLRHRWSGHGAQGAAGRREPRLGLGPAPSHEVGQVAPLAAVDRADLAGQATQEALDLTAVALGHAAHQEDGGGREVLLAGGQLGQAQEGHLGVLHAAELVLERGELAHEASGAPLVDVGAELERVAQAACPGYARGGSR